MTYKQRNKESQRKALKIQVNTLLNDLSEEKPTTKSKKKKSDNTSVTIAKDKQTRTSSMPDCIPDFIKYGLQTRGGSFVNAVEEHKMTIEE